MVSLHERFLAEDDDKIDEIKASVADAFGEQHAVIQKDVTSRRAENARLRAEVDALRNQSVRATRTRCQSWSIVWPKAMAGCLVTANPFNCRSASFWPFRRSSCHRRPSC